MTAEGWMRVLANTAIAVALQMPRTSHRTHGRIFFFEGANGFTPVLDSDTKVLLEKSLQKCEVYAPQD